MVGFNPASAFSTPQATTRFSSPRKASSAEEDDFQPINTPTEEPEASAESEPAAQASKKRHAPLPQHFTPPVKPSGHNWLAYAGIGTVATGVGALGGFGYKAVHLPNSKIELKEGWEKLERTNSEVDGKLHLYTPKGSIVSHSLGKDIKELSVRNWFKDDTTVNSKTVNGTEFVRTAYANAVQYRLIADNQSTIESTVEGLLVDANLPNGKLKDKSLYVAWENPIATYGIVMDGQWRQIEASENSSIPQANRQTSIIKPPNTNEGWQEKLTNLWEKLSLEHDNLDDVHAAFTKEGYTIEKGKYKLPEFRISLDAFNYKNWEEVAKAAVKNEKDWWKLVPKEGMGKFVGVGALAGLAVAGAGIGLWELAHKKQPSQPTLNRQG